MTRDTEALKALLAKVEAATEGGQELDEAIHAALRPDDPWWACILEGRRLVAAGEDLTYIVHPTSGSRMRAASWALSSRVASYTSSIDAALALVERVLPGMDGEIRWPSARRGNDEPSCRLRIAPLSSVENSAATRPLAILASLISAALAQGGHHDA